MTIKQILTIQAYILACVKHETAHHSEKDQTLKWMVEAQERMIDALATSSKSNEGGDAP